VYVRTSICRLPLEECLFKHRSKPPSGVQRRGGDSVTVGRMESSALELRGPLDRYASGGRNKKEAL